MMIEIQRDVSVMVIESVSPHCWKKYAAHTLRHICECDLVVYGILSPSHRRALCSGHHRLCAALAACCVFHLLQ